MNNQELKREIERLIAICGINRFSSALLEVSTLNKRGMVYKIAYFPMFWDKIKDIYAASDIEIQKLYKDLIEKSENKTLK